MDCTFCNFISKKKKWHDDYPKHGKDYPLIPVFENNEVFAFLSFPNFNKQIDLLVLPKKHYEFIEEIPEKLHHKMFPIVEKMAGIVRKNHGDCHILLNNGINAEQYAPHVHFHVIPKNSKKKIIWHDLSLNQFEKLSKELILLFQQLR